MRSRHVLVLNTTLQQRINQAMFAPGRFDADDVPSTEDESNLLIDYFV